MKVDGKQFDLNNDEIDILKTNKHSIEVEVDSFSFQYTDLKNELFVSNLHSRLTNSVEQGLNLADGLIILAGEKERLFSEKFSCAECGMSLPELEPRMFSFNSPLGACEKCRGLGTIYKIDPDLILNNKLTINEGGILPFNKMFFQDTWYIRLLKQVAEEEGLDMNLKIGNFDEKQLKILLHGTDKVYRVIGSQSFWEADRYL